MNETAARSTTEGMLVGELARRTGLTTATINFYVQQHLLPRPTKLNRTRALYGEKHLDRLAIIKRLQVEQGLPLALIRRLLKQADDDEQLLRRLADQRGPAFAQDLVELPGSGRRTRANRTREDLIRASGLSGEQLSILEQRGLLQAQKDDGLFDGAQVEAAKAFARLFQLGVGDTELLLYSDYLALQKRLATALYQRLLTSHRADWLGKRLSGRELSEISAAIEAYLRFRAASEQFPETLQRLVDDR